MQSRRILAAAGGPGTQDRDRKSTRLNSSHTVIYTLSLHDALPISEAVARYRVEPFVIAADVYAVPPHTGRGGWTWYTGSRSEEHTSELQSHSDLHSFPTRRSSDLGSSSPLPGRAVRYCSRRLCSPAAYWPRRVDLVHRI